ncbi:branched-chain amino acid ABC transporter permease [Marinomonas spartinae]|uniref:branched-chain amino acid ABC transporter permease n=1 Tax=Marinomonas spartinae TaxID=1792290 RepID=UPI0018F1856E|nr:branched-chain amino acid ABC transporter permease [Marinomonas spartinae]MBJ7556587.1 branched-chain amino acid ABC transporter permease [Marinomonas spartinae]
MLDAIIQGLLLGGYYAMLAAGLSLLFGVAKFINLAHGDLAILGAYLVLFGVKVLGLSPWLSVLLSLPIMGILGWLLQKYLFTRTQAAGFLLPLLVTFGLGAVLQNGLYGVFGSDTRSLANYIGDLSWDSWQLTDQISVGKLPVITFACAILVLAGLQLMLSFTRLGRAIRATASDPEAAELNGINANAVHCSVSAIAVMVTGLAGAFLAMRAQITPYDGPVQLIFAFEAVVIGGIGSLWGTLIGGIVLGISQSLGATLISAQWFQLTGHLVFLAVLTARFYSAIAHQRGGWRMFLKQSYFSITGSLPSKVTKTKIKNG